MAIHGSCLCGGVEIAVGEPFRRITYCHCTMCRKFHGSASAAYLSARKENVSVVKGEDIVRDYASSTWAGRSFCSKCGASLFYTPREGPWIGVAAGILDEDPGLRPIAHIFTASPTPWHEISGEIPQFGTAPSTEEWEALATGASGKNG